MSAEGYRPSAEVVERLRALGERRLSREEVEAALRTPVSDSEREEILALVAWFRRRYPTPLERLAYVRRAYRRWRRTLER
ncbi:MAG: hypothetical protein ACRD1Z_10420 [Vicinamibacteria bacterium]